MRGRKTTAIVRKFEVVMEVKHRELYEVEAIDEAGAIAIAEGMQGIFLRDLEVTDWEARSVKIVEPA